MPTHVVLRPNALSLYKNTDESWLKYQVDLSEVSSIALLPKHEENHEGVFDVFNPARNCYLDAGTLKASAGWINSIRKKADLRDDDNPRSPAAFSHHNVYDHVRSVVAWSGVIYSRVGGRQTSIEAIRMTRSREDSQPIPLQRAPAVSGSGNEDSDFSDAPFGSAASLTHALLTCGPCVSKFVGDARRAFYGTACAHDNTHDGARVDWHGDLLCLKAQKAVRCWTRCWDVLCPESMALYKNEEVCISSGAQLAGPF